MNLVATVAWASYPGPKDYRADEVPKAFEALTTAEHGASAVRFAVGNDHAGSVYPAAVPATGILLHILQKAPDAVRMRAADVLIDWYLSFWPEPGYEVFVDPATGRQIETMAEIRGQVKDGAAMLMGETRLRDCRAVIELFEAVAQR